MANEHGEIHMLSYEQKVRQAADWLGERIGGPPMAGIITGTGLGGLADMVQAQHAFDFSQIPHFPLSTVDSHAGRLLCGMLEGRRVLIFSGRFHLYEGYSALEVVFPVRVLQVLGAGVLVMTNASGGLNLDFATGDIMVIADHINLTGHNPLVGPESLAWGERFPAMSRAYDPELIQLAENAGHGLGIALRRGVYAALLGPSLETGAEMRLLRAAGADCVGLSTVCETIAAVQAKMRVLAFSVITNMNISGRHAPPELAEIIQAAQNASKPLSALIGHVLAQAAAAPCHDA